MGNDTGRTDGTRKRHRQRRHSSSHRTTVAGVLLAAAAALVVVALQLSVSLYSQSTSPALWSTNDCTGDDNNNGDGPPVVVVGDGTIGGRSVVNSTTIRSNSSSSSALLPIPLAYLKQNNVGGGGIKMSSSEEEKESRRQLEERNFVRYVYGREVGDALLRSLRDDQGRADSNGNNCSCATPTTAAGRRSRTEAGVCCRRLFRRVHKMGFILTGTLFGNQYHKREITMYGVQPLDFDYLTKPMLFFGHGQDFRDVLLWRNIYDSIVSGYVSQYCSEQQADVVVNGMGYIYSCFVAHTYMHACMHFTFLSFSYLYHKDGRECYKDPWGNPSTQHHYHLVRSWTKHISLEIPVSKRKMVFCNYLLREPEDVGMRAYMEWVFRAHYQVELAAFGIAMGIRHVGERTKSVCYEDLASKDSDRVNRTMTSLLNFLYNGTDHKPWQRIQQLDGDGGDSYGGANSDNIDTGNATRTVVGHSTSKDPDLRRRLIELVKRIDFEYYRGDVAWLDSVLPC